MSSLEFYNKQVSLVGIFYDSHRELIEKLCYEFGRPDRVDELCDKFLDRQVKLKAKKDPNRPKRPKSSYFFFSDKYRSDHKKELEGLPIMDVSKIVGKKWRELSDEKKVEYEVMAKTDKEDYKVAWEQYQQSLFNPLVQPQAVSGSVI